MDCHCVTIDCNIPHTFLHKLKQLLQFLFKVQIKVENFSLKIFGSELLIQKCIKLIELFKNSDCQYFLPISYFSKEALEINNLILLFESKCNVLILLDDVTLHLYGHLANVAFLYDFLLKHDRIVAKKDNFEVSFGKEDEIKLNLLCEECRIDFPRNTSRICRFFVYNILLNRDILFRQLAESELSINNVKVKGNNVMYGDGGAESYKYGATHGESVSKERSECRPDLSLLAINNNKVRVSSEKYDNGGADRESVSKESNPIISNNNISKFRTIIIDGNNLAFGHGGDKFSSMGIKIAIDYFVNRGHSKIYAMLPRHRQPLGGHIFEKLERDNQLKYTPSRILNNVRETPYDDRFILDAAVATGGVVISNDQYRDLMSVEKYKDIIINNLIPYTFIEDHLIIPNDPRGFNGPSLSTVLANPLNTVDISQRKTPIVKYTEQCYDIPRNYQQQQQHQPTQQFQELQGHHQRSLFNKVLEIFPNESSLIRQIILGNPGTTDLTRIINFVSMAIDHNKNQ